MYRKTQCTDLHSVKQDLGKRYNDMSNTTCTLMLLSNLAKPLWTLIDCNKPMLHIINCVKSVSVLNYTDQNLEKARELYMCASTDVIVGLKCFILSWKFRNADVTAEELCTNSNSIQPKQFSNLVEAISINTKFPPLFSKISLHTAKVIVYYWLLNVLNSRQYVADIDDVEGFHICLRKRLKVQTGFQIFHCEGGGFISQDSICDGMVDCPFDSSDEFSDLCVPNYNITKEDTFNGKVSCAQVYFMTANGLCFKYRNSMNFQKHYSVKNDRLQQRDISVNISSVKVKRVFNVKSEKFLPEKNVYAESVLKPIISSLHKIASCPNPYELTCFQGQPACFSIYDICHYRLNMLGQIKPCKNGAHVQNCQKFECNKLYKCKNSYCIQWTYVCDGKWDCPVGDDEGNICTAGNICQYMYKCMKSLQNCVPLSALCDGVNDCLYSDDENFCDLNVFSCPDKCRCLLYSIVCRSSIDIFLDYSVLLFLDIENINLIFFKTLRHIIQSIPFVRLVHNNIREICKIDSSDKCIALDLGSNMLDNICLSSFPHLIQLRINSNKFSQLKGNSFRRVPKLLYLNVSRNPITALSIEIFDKMPKIRIFDVSNIDFKTIDKKCTNYYSRTFKIILAHDQDVCCTMPHGTFCSAPQLWYLSCSNILPDHHVNTLYIIVSLLIILLNFLSSLLLNFPHESNKSFCILVFAVNTNDVLIGFYLSIIWISNAAIKDNFYIMEKQWKSGFLCFTCFGILLWFSTLGQAVLLLQSFARLNIVSHPLNNKFRQREFVFKLAILSFCSCFLMSFTITLLFKFTNDTVPTALCLPFVDPVGSSTIIMVITFFILTTQSASSLVIVLTYIFLIKNVKSSQQILSKYSLDTESNISLMFQLILITLSNILCWFPVNIIYVSIMFLPRYPLNLLIWSTIIILPLNSIINPCVFIYTSIRKLWRHKQSIHK